MMNASRSIRGGWCGTAVLIVFAAAMLAASITPALAYPISTPNYAYGDIGVNTSGTGTLSAGSVSQNTQVAGWELWNNSKSIHINNTGGSALTYYQINISIPDGINETSLRVVNETSNTAVPHWCENCTGGKCYELWFNATYIPASSCNTYAVYYGNDAASSMSDYNTTFTKSYNTSGLVMELHMDEGSGNIRTNDTSGCGNNGTLTNMNVTGNATSGWQGVDGGQWDSRSDVVFSGDQLRFDGSNDYVNVPDHPTLGITGHITLEAWVNFSSINSGGWTGLVTKWNHSGTGRGYGLFKHNSANAVAFVCSPTSDGYGDAQANSPPSLNTWYHVVGTYDGSTMRLYINGILQSDTGAISPASIYDNSEPVEIGTFEEFNDYYFNGLIDEVRIYNRSLSGDEIYRQYIRSKYAANAPTATISAAPADTTPPVPTNLNNTTSNYWVNYTWTAGNGVVTDGYNVSMNEEWHNGTKTFWNSNVGAGNWSNITVWAWNKTGSGNMSATSVSDTVQAPSALAGAPNITSYAPATPVISDEGVAMAFNVTVNQTVNATWYINGSVAQPNTTASTEVAYTNASAVAGYW
ncbi:MAG: DUF2341 domain-containing protein, partial [Gammaproteobacteria bacterium]|nr:DUF2341 domain-containing protein [Gammaproteobacteria bacterium]